MAHWTSYESIQSEYSTLYMIMEFILYEPWSSSALFAPGNSRPSTTVQARVVGGMVCQGESGRVRLVSNVLPTRLQIKPRDILLTMLFDP